MSPVPASAQPAYRKKWQLDRQRGIHRTIPAKRVAEHIERLLASGFTRRGISETAGCSPTVIARILSGGQPTVQTRTAARLLAVHPYRIHHRDRDHGFVPAIGARRRIQALLAIGHRHADITARIRAHGSQTQSQLVLLQAGNLLERRTSDAVRGAYNDLWATPGPSSRTRSRAAARGYAPPLAWDDDTIDDPAARPAGVIGAMQTSRAALVEDVAELVAHGATVTEACHRLGKKRGALQRSLYRSGEHDLWLALSGHQTTGRRTA